jgi:hypothetical protein
MTSCRLKVTAANLQAGQDSTHLIGTQQQLIHSQEGQLELSKEIATEVTGGDAYCYIILLPDTLHNRPDLLRVELMNNGLTPVYEVNYSVMEMVKPGESRLAEKIKATIYGYEQIVYGATGNGLLTMTSNYVQPGEYAVHIRARNGSLTEIIKVLPSQHGFSYETVVNRDSDGKVLANNRF